MKLRYDEGPQSIYTPASTNVWQYLHRELLKRADWNRIIVVCPPGSGKSFAVKHLCGRIGKWTLLDDPDLVNLTNVEREPFIALTCGTGLFAVDGRFKDDYFYSKESKLYTRVYRFDPPVNVPSKDSDSDEDTVTLPVVVPKDQRENVTKFNAKLSEMMSEEIAEILCKERMERMKGERVCYKCQEPCIYRPDYVYDQRQKTPYGVNVCWASYWLDNKTGQWTLDGQDKRVVYVCVKCHEDFPSGSKVYCQW